jgi:ubiquinone/menaquinone biosynthesis C-methylase UbiE
VGEAKSIIRSYWDERASTFDMSPGHVASSRREEEAWKALLRKRIGTGGKRVLDVGVGTGFLSIMLAEMGYNVVGVDLSEEMIKNARRKMDARGLKVRLEVGDAENLPFEDGSFDAVVNRAVLWTIPNPKKALSEWKRVLKPDGTLCFFLHGRHSKGLFHRSKRQFTNLAILAREKRNPWKSLYNSVDLPMGGGADSAVVVDLLKKAGYVDIGQDPLVEIGKMKRERMPWYYRLSSEKIPQYCYYCIKPKRR